MVKGQGPNSKKVVKGRSPCPFFSGSFGPFGPFGGGSKLGLRGRQTLPGSSYFSKPHSGLGALGWGVPRMVVFRQVWVPDTPPTRFLPLIDINEAYTLCSGAQGALWGPWTVWVCGGAPTAKGRQFVGCSPCGRGDHGPMFVASNTLNWPCYGYALVWERGGHGAGIGGRLTVTVGLCHL